MQDYQPIPLKVQITLYLLLFNQDIFTAWQHYAHTTASLLIHLRCTQPYVAHEIRCA